MLLRRRKYESRRGFTMVELVVVLVILAILASVAVPAFSRQLETGRERKAVTEAQACVTAATGLGAQKYTEARTAHIQDNSKSIRASLVTWAGAVQDDRPAVTGTLAQREGSAEYLLTPQNTPDGTAAGAAEVKAAAGVDGTVLNFWCNANGQVVYLLYRSADDILVAYANDGNSGDNSIVIPTANVPTPVPTTAPVPTVAPTPATTPTTTVTPSTETPKPTATPIDSSGQIKIYCYDENGEKLDGVTLFLNGYAWNNLGSIYTPSWSSSRYNAKGFSIGSTTSSTELQVGPTYYIVESGLPEYYQRVLKYGFSISGNSTSGYSLNLHKEWDANGHVEIDNSNTEELIVKLYHKPMQLLTIHKQAPDGTPLAHAVFTITNYWTNVSPVSRTLETDENGDAVIPLEYTYYDGSSWYDPIFNGLANTQKSPYTLTEITPPTGYKAASSINFQIDWNSSSESYTVSSLYGAALPSDITLSGTTFTIVDQPILCDVSITKEKYDLDNNNKPTTNTSSLAGAELAILDSNSREVAHWTSTSTAKTVQLQPGRYTLHEITAPSSYLLASDIPFTVKSGQESLTLKMIDPSIKDEDQSGNISGDDFNVSFEAKSWAHKLTHDGQEKNSTNWNLKLSSELLLWKGELYYNYTKLDNIPNEKEQYYADYFDAHGEMPADALDPIAYLDALYKQPSANVPKPGSSYVVKLTGNVRGWAAGQNTFNKGDILIVTTVSTDKNGVATTSYKPFVFIGNDNSSVILPSTYINVNAMKKLNFASMNSNVLTITTAS